MVRAALGTAGGTGVVGTVMAAGWLGVALVLLVVVIVVGAVCWVIADPDRPARLALLINSWRGRAPARTARPAPRLKAPSRRSIAPEVPRPARRARARPADPAPADAE